MSYSLRDAENEFYTRVDEVLQTRDIYGARELAEVLSEMGDDQEAETFIRMSKQWEAEDDAHDHYQDFKTVAC
jgi:hypothetical protein